MHVLFVAAIAYIFGAVCPALEKGAALVMPRTNTEASCRRHASSMLQKHLGEISLSVAADAHGVIIIPFSECRHSPVGQRDGAGRHKAGALNIPEDLSILFLPPYSPELDPTGNFWRFLRQTHLSTQVFENWQAIVDACCDA